MIIPPPTPTRPRAACAPLRFRTRPLPSSSAACGAPATRPRRLPVILPRRPPTGAGERRLVHGRVGHGGHPPWTRPRLGSLTSSLTPCARRRWPGRLPRPSSPPAAAVVLRPRPSHPPIFYLSSATKFRPGAMATRCVRPRGELRDLDGAAKDKAPLISNTRACRSEILDIHPQLRQPQRARRGWHRGRRNHNSITPSFRPPPRPGDPRDIFASLSSSSSSSN